MKRPLGSTGLRVSPLGLGTVLFGRTERLKYPGQPTILSDSRVRALLDLCRDSGMNLLDTAPAYGNSEERLGQLLAGERRNWVISSKVGEQFERGRSSFDFTPQCARKSIERSLRRLRTDYLDLVLVHSNGEDVAIIRQSGIINALLDLKKKGVIRAIGFSSKTVAGGIMALENGCDVVMVTHNPWYQDELDVIDFAHQQGKGVLVKKPFDSGRFGGQNGNEGADRALHFILSQPGVSSVLVGTGNPHHLAANIQSILARFSD